MERRVTIKDVGAKAGVHHTTVSLALRNHPSIPETTRARIRAAAEALGYRPDPVLASLMRYRRAMHPRAQRPVALWLTNYETRGLWRRTRVFEEYFNGAKERAEQLGFQLEEFWLREHGMSVTRARQIFHARGITAMLIAPQPRDGLSLDLAWEDMAAVSLGYTLARPRLNLVTCHHFASMRVLMENLFGLGYGRPGLALPVVVDHRVHRGWLGGYLVAQTALPMSRRLAPFLFEKLSDAALSRWLRRARPDVVIAAITQQDQAWDALGRLGWRVPEDIGVAFTSLHEAKDKRAGISENPRVIGATAMDMLSGQWQRNERGVPATPVCTLIEGTWRMGTTVRRMI